ncbi:AgmX/PglI C-terminal domain-containing protein [Hydrocarboniphaga effusa]|uniref:AgmX/PglI C-terminal domain-containing protein n=1 Tax=Hydrocarboniphaga effusa TaxID=243629 RepID=UPI003137BD36
MTAATFHNQPLGLDSWGIAQESDRKFRRIVGRVLAPVAVCAIAIPWLHFEIAEQEVITSVAELIVLPEPELPKVQPQPEEKTEPKAEPAKQARAETRPLPATPAEKPKPAEQASQPAPNAARELASRSGIMQFNDRLSAMRNDDALEAANQALLTSDAPNPRSASNTSALGASIAGAAASHSAGGANTNGIAGNDAGTRLGSRRTEAVQSGIGYGRGNGGGGAAGTASGAGPAATRTPQEIQLVFDRNKTAFFALFNRAARSNPNMGAGTIVMRLTIQADGSVSDCALVSSSFGDPELEEKILQRVRLMNFGAKNVGVFVYPNYPLAYLPP